MEGPSPVGVKIKALEEVEGQKGQNGGQRIGGGASEMGADTDTEGKKKKREEERTQPQHMVLGSWVVELGTPQSSELVYPMPLLAVGLYHGQV